METLPDKPFLISIKEWKDRGTVYIIFVLYDPLFVSVYGCFLFFINAIIQKSCTNTIGYWCLTMLHLFKGQLVSIGVHGGQKVDASLFDQVDDTLVTLFVLLAHVLHEIQQKFSTQHLVPVHPSHITKLWLTCREHHNTDTALGIKATNVTCMCISWQFSCLHKYSC